MHIDHDRLQLVTESDVEQKVVMPLLTDGVYLDIPTDKVFTKQYLAPTVLDKAAGREGGYYPDYAIWLRGFPVLVVEAKAPGVPPEVGYREASLYARHLNQFYPTNVNPCSFLIATNGETLLFGHWDTQPEFIVPVTELRLGSRALARLQESCQMRALESHALDCLQRVRARNPIYPYNLAGGQALLLAKLPVNLFAADLSPILRLYFSSSYQEHNREIIERAYVSSAEVTEYDRVLEALLKDHLTVRRGTIVRELQPGRHGEDNVEQAIFEFDQLRPESGRVQIVQGSVGSGKSLFIRRYKEVLQPPELAERTRWAFVDFNSSPPDLADGVAWLCGAFVEDFQRENTAIDLSSGAVLRGVFSRNIQKRKAIYEELAKTAPQEAALERARDLSAWQDDPQEMVRGISEYVLGSRHEILITVMDNVDRLDLKNQLDAFQLALWFMHRTRCFVILQMRDETYERYKNRPPLDAFRSGITFHITPPRFVDVVKRRLELSLEYLTENARKQQSYAIETGLRVSYPRSALGVFLHTLYSEIFDRGRNISRLLEALAGRNVRKALDMFVSIITSGHLSETAITSTVLGGLSAPIREWHILKILMRTEYRFFSDHSGFLFNVFNSDPDWQKPDNFLLIEVLYFLARNRKQKGEIGLEGYFTCRRVTEELQRLGYVPEDVLAGINMLLRGQLVGADHMNFDAVQLDDAVRVLASGYMHVRILVARMEYLYGVVPATPIFDPTAAEQLADFVRQENQRAKISQFQMARAVEIFYRYLLQQSKANATPFSMVRETGAAYVLSHVSGVLEHSRNIRQGTPKELDSLDL